MRKTLVNLLLLILVFAAGLFVANYISLGGKKVIENDSVVVLERIKKVAKLVTVEGYYSESYTKKEWENSLFGYHWKLDAFKKEAKLKVSAKVLVGFDLEKMIFETSEEEKKFYISHLPEPEIMSIEPNIEYEKMYEGIFNNFSNEERTELNQSAIKYIKDVASKDERLKENAIMQGYEFLKIIEVLARDAGWEVEYINDKSIPKLIIDSLKIKG